MHNIPTRSIQSSTGLVWSLQCGEPYGGISSGNLVGHWHLSDDPSEFDIDPVSDICAS
jgi:hypothetical protein